MWKLSLVVAMSVAAAFSVVAAEPKAEFKGRLKTGIVAIGGETTGIILDTKDGTLELDLHGDKVLVDKASKLDGKQVVVSGKLEVRKGVEVKERKIVVVETLDVAK